MIPYNPELAARLEEAEPITTNPLVYGRACGNTTRQADQLIQLLFTYPTNTEFLVIDHSRLLNVINDQVDKNLLDIVLRRLYKEHDIETTANRKGKPYVRVQHVDSLRGRGKVVIQPELVKIADKITRYTLISLHLMH